MGRGDKRTAKGKRFRHSFGVSRPKNAGKNKGKAKGQSVGQGTKSQAAAPKKAPGRK